MNTINSGSAFNALLSNLEANVDELRECVNWHTEYLKEQNKKINEVVYALEVFSDAVPATQETMLQKSQAQSLIASLLSKAAILDKPPGIYGFMSKIENKNLQFQELSIQLESFKMNLFDHYSGCYCDKGIDQYKEEFRKIVRQYESLESICVEMEPEFLSQLNQLGPRRLKFSPELKAMRNQLVMLWGEQSIKSLQFRWSIDYLEMMLKFLPQIDHLTTQSKDEVESIRKLKTNANFVNTHMSGYYLKEDRKTEFKVLFDAHEGVYLCVSQQARALQDQWPEILANLQIAGFEEYPEELAPSSLDKDAKGELCKLLDEHRESILKERIQLYALLKSSWSKLVEFFNEYGLQIHQIEKMTENGSLPYKSLMLFSNNNSLTYTPPDSF